MEAQADQQSVTALRLRQRTAIAQATADRAHAWQDRVKQSFSGTEEPSVTVQGMMLISSALWLVAVISASVLDFKVSLALTHGSVVPAAVITTVFVLASTGLAIGLRLAVSAWREDQTSRQQFVTVMVGVVIGLVLVLTMLGSLAAKRAEASFQEARTAAQTVYRDTMASQEYQSLRDTAAQDERLYDQAVHDAEDPVVIKALEQKRSRSAQSLADFTDSAQGAMDGEIWRLEQRLTSDRNTWIAAGLFAGLLEFFLALSLPTTVLLVRYQGAKAKRVLADRALTAARNEQESHHLQWIQQMSRTVDQAGVTPETIHDWLQTRAQATAMLRPPGVVEEAPGPGGGLIIPASITRTRTRAVERNVAGPDEVAATASEDDSAPTAPEALPEAPTEPDAPGEPVLVATGPTPGFNEA